LLKQVVYIGHITAKLMFFYMLPCNTLQGTGNVIIFKLQA